MRYLGEDGYLELARELLEKKAHLLDGIDKIKGLKAWQNDLLPVCFGATDIDLAEVKGNWQNWGGSWSPCATPPLINIPLDAATDDKVIDLFLRDLESVAERVRSGDAKERAALEY